VNLNLAPVQWLAVGVVAFVAYNSAVTIWEQQKPDSSACVKCSVARVAAGAGLAGVSVYLAFGVKNA
jgi:hypothetical protein